MESEPTYTVFVRLPFPRGDFVDPPPVNWNSSKDEALWSILSAVSKNDIDWNEVATRFQVTVDFLLQQVTFLTERHASQVRAQMRKAAAASKGSSAHSPIPGAEATGLLAGGEPMHRAGSGGGPRAPSSLSVRRGHSPLPGRADNVGGSSTPGTPIRGPGRPPASRTSSTSTATAHTAILPRGPVLKTAAAERRRLSSLPIAPQATTTSLAAAPQQDPLSPGPADDEDEPSSDTASSKSSPAQSRVVRRPPTHRFAGSALDHHGVGAAGEDDDDDDDDDDDEAEPAFLPFKSPLSISAVQGVAGSGGASAQPGGQDLGATLRLTKGGKESQGKGKAVATSSTTQQSQTSDSSASSAALLTTSTGSGTKPAVDRSKTSSSSHQGRPGPLSPRRTAELAAKGGSKGYSREGSDGTPSMGSSFSDLDDASITQSALEEALASKMQEGGTIGSRMSTISQAIRSRYMPKGGPSQRPQ